MTRRNEWEEFFDGHAPVYMENCFTKNTELAMLLRQAGFEVEHIWGGTAGDWERRKIQLDEMEIMVVARKATKVA